MSCAVPSSAERPSCSVRDTLRLSWCWRSSRRFLNCSNFLLSMYVSAAPAAAFLIFAMYLGQTMMIFADVEGRQLGDGERRGGCAFGRRLRDLVLRRFSDRKHTPAIPGT